MHTYIHTNIHACMHAYIHTNTPVCRKVSLRINSGESFRVNSILGGMINHESDKSYGVLPKKLYNLVINGRTHVLAAAEHL